MKIKETLNKGLKREYELVIPADFIEKKLNDRLMKLGKKAKVPGFRPGKVPLPMLKQQYGMEVLGEVLEKSVDDSVNEVIEKNKLSPALRPEIEAKEQYEEGKDLQIIVKMEVLPEVDEIKLDGLKFDKLQPKIDTKKVDEAINDLAKRHRDTKPIEKARKTKKGDIAIIDFEGWIGKKAIDGGKGESHPLELGSGEFIPGFEDQLIGKDKGEKVEVKVNFPEEYGQPDLAGQEARFEVVVKDIHEAEKTKVDDELAKKMGFEDLKSCREAIEGYVTREDRDLAFMHTKRTVLDALEDKCKFEVPDNMVKAEFDTIWHQMLHEADIAHQCSADAANKNDTGSKSFKDATGKSEDELKKEYEAIAARRVRLGLLLADIGKRNEITVSEGELTQALVAEARRYPGQEKEVIDYYRSNSNALAALRAPIFEDKVVDFILSKAKVTDKDVTHDELKAMLESDDEVSEKPKKKKAPAKKTTKTAKSK